MTKYFNCDESLRLERSLEPIDVAGTRLREEGVETLIALNLRTLFPMWQLDLRQLSDVDWGTPDLVATDALGTVHVFEIKDEGSAEGLLEQALSYALTTMVRWQMPLASPFDDPRVVARRIAGVWANVRTDKVGSADVPYEARPTRMLEVVAQKLDTNPEQWLAHARGHVGFRQSPRPLSPADVHVHIVAETIDESLRERAAILRRRGARLSLWELVARRGDRSLTVKLTSAMESDDSSAAQLIERIARRDSSAVWGLAWRLENDSLGRVYAAYAPEEFGLNVRLCATLRDGLPALVWSTSVPEFAKVAARQSAAWRERLEHLRAHRQRVAEAISAAAPTACVEVTPARIWVRFSDADWDAAAGASLRAVRGLRQDAGRVARWDDLPWVG